MRLAWTGDMGDSRIPQKIGKIDGNTRVESPQWCNLFKLHVTYIRGNWGLPQQYSSRLQKCVKEHVHCRLLVLKCCYILCRRILMMSKAILLYCTSIALKRALSLFIYRIFHSSTILSKCYFFQNLPLYKSVKPKPETVKLGAMCLSVIMIHS